MAVGVLRVIAVAACVAALAAVAGCGSQGRSDQGVRVRARAASLTPSPPAPPTPPSRPPVPAGGRSSAAATKPAPAATGYPYGAISMTGTSAVALTFDDGPTWTWTAEILAVLREHKVRATFCVVGRMARAYPDRIRQIVADGHTLCNHSYDHNTNLGSLSDAQIRANLQATNDAIRAAVHNAKISYYRQPGGVWTPRVVKVAAEMGMTSIHWDVDPRDWARPGAQAIASHVTANTRPGSIVLLHDGGGDRSGTLQALRLMLPTLESRFQLIPLPPRAPASSRLAP